MEPVDAMKLKKKCKDTIFFADSEYYKYANIEYYNAMDFATSCSQLKNILISIQKILEHELRYSLRLYSRDNNIAILMIDANMMYENFHSFINEYKHKCVN